MKWGEKSVPAGCCGYFSHSLDAYETSPEKALVSADIVVETRTKNCGDPFCSHEKEKDWKLPSASIPAGTQRPKDVPLWSYFGRDVPDYNRTKIGSIRFITYFDSTMSDLSLVSRKVEKFP